MCGVLEPYKLYWITGWVVYNYQRYLGSSVEVEVLQDTALDLWRDWSRQPRAEMMFNCFKLPASQPASQLDNNKLNLTADLLSNKLDLLLITG